MPKAIAAIFVIACLASAALGAAIYRYDWFPMPLVRELRNAVLAAVDSMASHGSIIMLGDSITASGQWDDASSDTKVYNRGISGDTTQGVLARLDSLLATRPAKVFLLIGINDLQRGDEPLIILDRYESIVRKIVSAGAELVAQSVILTRMPQLNQRVASVNEGIERICARTPRCTFIDLNKILAPQGTLLYPDDVHLSAEGHQLWRGRIRSEMQIRHH